MLLDPASLLKIISIKDHINSILILLKHMTHLHYVTRSNDSFLKDEPPCLKPLDI
jgi:hypothetical protein